MSNFFLTLTCSSGTHVLGGGADVAGVLLIIGGLLAAVADELCMNAATQATVQRALPL